MSVEVNKAAMPFGVNIKTEKFEIETEIEIEEPVIEDLQENENNFLGEISMGAIHSENETEDKVSEKEDVGMQKHIEFYLPHC